MSQFAQQPYPPQFPGQPFGGQPFAPPAPQYAPAPPAFAQQFPAAPQFPQQMPMGMPQGFGGFAPQQFAPAFPQAAPVAPGDLTAFFGQPKTGRAPSVSWKGAPDGATLQGVIAEDVSDRDVVPDTDPNTKQVRRFNDGNPKYVLAIPLRVPASPAFPEGLATLYARGDVWEKMQAAMAAAGRQGAPCAGDLVSITLVERKQGRGTVPKNVFSVRYAPAGTDGQAVAQPAQTWTPPPAEQAPPAPAGQWAAPQAPQQFAPAQMDPAALYAQQVAAQQAAQYAQPTAPQMPAAPQFAPQAPAQALPVQQVPQAPVAPGAPVPGLPGLSAEQMALLAGLTGNKG